jgi:hypothetical protein
MPSYLRQVKKMPVSAPLPPAQPERKGRLQAYWSNQMQGATPMARVPARRVGAGVL